MRCPPNQHLSTAARCPDAPTGVRGDYAPRSRRSKKPETESSGFLVNKKEPGSSEEPGSDRQKDAVSNFIGRISNNGTRSLLFLFDIPGPNFYTLTMAKKKRLFTKFFLGTLFILGIMILFLELGSRLYREPDQDYPAYEWAVCDLDRYSQDEGKLIVIQELVGKKARGEKITREDLDRALISAPQDHMPGLNGVVCNQMIFVSSRLPESARYYVTRHELEHVFQLEGMDGDCQDWELCATWAAAWEYPLGLLRTITSSLREAYRISPSFWSFLFSSWRVFKFTLLP